MGLSPLASTDWSASTVIVALPFEATLVGVTNVQRRALLAAGMASERADLSARLFAEASRDGVASHGLNRFPRFMRMVNGGIVDVRARPHLVAAHGAVERWDGARG